MKWSDQLQATAALGLGKELAVVLNSRIVLYFVVKRHLAQPFHSTECANTAPYNLKRRSIKPILLNMSQDSDIKELTCIYFQ
jgi:hypothetical protein